MPLNANISQSNVGHQHNQSRAMPAKPKLFYAKHLRISQRFPQIASEQFNPKKTTVYVEKKNATVP